MIVLNQKQKRILLILGVVAVLLLAMVAIITAIRLQQVGTEPVAPSVPKSKPRAEEVIPTPGADSACLKTFQIAQGPTLTPTPTGTITPTPTGTITPTVTPTGGLACTDLHILAGTTNRPMNVGIEFECQGSPTSQIKNCRFRFGDGSDEVLDADCKVSHTYIKVGTYATSCEVQDQAGNWQAATACEESLQIVSGPTATATPGQSGQGVTAIPTVPQQSLPQAGGVLPTIGAAVGGLGIILLGLLLLL